MEPRDLPVTAALGALSVTVALAFGRVIAGDRWILPLVAAALVPHVVGAISRAAGQRSWVEVVTSAIVFATAVVVLTPGGASTVSDRVDAGWSVVRHHAVPVPPLTGIVILAALGVLGVALLADHLAFRRDAAVGALGPGVVVVIWCTALGTHDGRWLTVLAFGLAATVFLALQHQRLLEHQRTQLLAPRRVVSAPRMLLVGVLTGSLAVAFGVAGAVALPDADRPLVDTGGLGDHGGGARSYKTAIPPLLDVGDKLRQQATQNLFTVQADQPDYWRITALDQYSTASGGQWSLTAQGNDAVGQGLDESVPKRALVQHYAIGPMSERWMPAAYQPVRVSRGDTLVVRASSTLVTGQPTVSGLQYTVSSVLPERTIDAAARRDANGAVPDDLQQYTRLPPDLPTVVAQTAASVAGSIGNPIDQAAALRDYFRGGSFTYDPNFNAGDDETAMAAFLRDRRGFCVQFATAYALMARALGIPARVAVGFTPGTFDAATGTYVVTNHDAHAWPELWFSGLGWTHLFDPTPASNLPGGSALPDEIPPATQPAGTTVTTTVTTTPPATSPPATTPGASTPPASAAPSGGVHIAADEPGSPASSGPVWPFLLAGALVVLVAAPLATILLVKRRRRARRRRDPDPRRAIFGAWSEAVDALTDHRVPTSPTETPLELADRVGKAAGDDAAPPLQALAGAYTAARYGETTPPAATAAHAWDDVDVLRRTLASSGSLWERARARWSLRTFSRDRTAV
jgi:transglutaminase-like putative cysteine protease